MGGNPEDRKSVTRSGKLNNKPRLSAFEDFVKRTLSDLHGVWSKLNYIRELRESDGRYKHWGLARTYGEDVTNEMIADVHSEIYLQILRSPLPELFEQLEMSAEDADCSASQLAEQLLKQKQRVTPVDMRGGAPEHMRSVLLIHDLLGKDRVKSSK
jgi:hypothetical protein